MNWDLDRAVLVIGKGPSARWITSCEDYYIAAANDASRFAARIDFQFCSDDEGFCWIPPDKWDCIDHLITTPKLRYPTKPEHVTFRDIIKPFPDQITVHYYRVRGVPPDPTGKIPDFDVRSTGEAAFAWLLLRGFRRFISLGIDASGGYHPDVMSSHVQANKWFESNVERIQEKVDAAGASWTRL